LPFSLALRRWASSYFYRWPSCWLLLAIIVGWGLFLFFSIK
jgi:hypothetical protein